MLSRTMRKTGWRQTIAGGCKLEGDGMVCQLVGCCMGCVHHTEGGINVRSAWRGLRPSCFFILCFFSALGLTSGSRLGLQRLSEAHFEFSIDLYRQVAVASPAHSNIVLSAHAANVGVALLFLGSTANTLGSQQLRSSLHYENMTYVEVHKAYKQVVSTLSEPYYKKHNFASKVELFLQQGVGIKGAYERAVREFYQGNISSIDFTASGSGHVASSINRWISSVSDGELTQLVEADPTSDTRLIIGSYARLVPRWLYPFDPLKTSYNGLFFLPGNQRLQVAMMSAQLEVPVGYSQQLEARLLELPLLDRRMSMFLILPDQVEPGIQALEQNITTNLVKDLMATLQTEVVNVRIPRFRIEETTELVPSLQGLGVDQVTKEGDADLQNMVNMNIVHLSNFIHRADIDVREWGEHGSSTTPGGTTSKTLGVLRQKFFEVDHPFVYFIWDYFSGTILLIGRVVRPIVL